MTSNKEVFYTFNPKEINWKFTVKHSNRRMKLYIKMTKAETSQWEELRKAAKPPEMTDDEFAKILFYRGIDAFMSQMTDLINNMPEDEKAKMYAEAGVDVPEEEKEPTREELAALGNMSETSTEKQDA